MVRVILTFVAFVLSFGHVVGQDQLLDTYIKEGLKSNHALKQQQLDYAKSLLSLKEARGLFFPDIRLNARYTVADGGRIIEFPVGDLLNPVYNTLNLLTASEQFPEIENQEFSFYRPREHETKVSVLQPIFSSDLIYNYKIRKTHSNIIRVGIDQYKRELIKEIKIAYYNYLKAWSLSNIVDSSIVLVKENLRVSRSLFDNDMVTSDIVYRSEAEVSKVMVEQANARSMVQTSRSYFNFLLNRQLEEEIKVSIAEPDIPLNSIESMQQSASENREELDLIRASKVLNDNRLSLQRGNASPGLYGSIDYGYQGKEYKFGPDNDFVLASLVLQWQIFHGMSNRNKIKQTKIEGDKIGIQLEEAESQIQLQVLNTYYKVLAAYQNIESEKKHKEASRRAFDFVAKKYLEGQTTLIEYIDARTSYTNAESQLIIAKNEYYLQMAELEYAAGIVSLTKYSE